MRSCRENTQFRVLAKEDSKLEGKSGVEGCGGARHTLLHLCPASGPPPNGASCSDHDEGNQQRSPASFDSSGLHSDDGGGGTPGGGSEVQGGGEWGCFIAVAPISPGDIITANYVGYGPFRCVTV